MSMKINPPDFVKAQTFEDYLLELDAWSIITNLDKKKQGLAVCLGLSDRSEHESDIKTKAFRALGKEKLGAENGLDQLVTFMKEELGKDDFSTLLDAFEEFEKFKFDSKKHLNITAYISDFETIVMKMEKQKTKLPGSMLCFKLIRKAGCSQTETQTIIKDVDFTTEDDDAIYKAAKAALKKYKGDLVTGSKTDATTVKLEEADLAEHEDVLVSLGWYKRRGTWRGGRGRGGSRGGGGHHGGGDQITSGESKKRRRNPKDEDGNFKRCNICESINHYAYDCPDKNVKVEEINMTETEEAILFTSNDIEEVLLSVEASQSAVVDTACTSTVCGEDWLEDFENNLSKEEKKKMKENAGARSFRFGDGKTVKSKRFVHLPVTLGGKHTLLGVDVVDAKIPLLLSKKTLKKMGMKLNMIDDTAEIFGKIVTLNETSSGHYCINLRPDRILIAEIESREISDSEAVEVIFLVELQKCSDRERVTKVEKLHRQFGHTGKDRFVKLLKSAGAWFEQQQSIVDNLYSKCDICKIFAKKPNKPAVSMPLASRFNQVVTMDLKKWNYRLFPRHKSKKNFWATQATQTVQTTKLQGILLSNRTAQPTNTVETAQLQAFSVAYKFFLGNSTTRGAQTTKLQLKFVA